MRLVDEWRAQGLRVQVLQGVFDLLQAAHARRVIESRRAADRLVVLIAGDQAATTLGPGRPAMMQDERARLVAGLRGVDAVAPLPEAEALDPEVDLELEREAWRRVRSPSP